MKKLAIAIVLLLSSYGAQAIGTRTYDAPIPTPDITNSQVMRFGIIVVLGPTGAPSSDTFFKYVINTRAAGNEVIETHAREIKWGALPAGVRDDLKGIHNLILNDAENQGLIPTGIDSDDL